MWIAIAFGVAKGLLVASVLAALDVPFLKSLIIAVVSGAIGTAGAIIAAYMAIREARRNRDLLHDVKGKIDADRRAVDKQKGEPC